MFGQATDAVKARCELQFLGSGRDPGPDRETQTPNLWRLDNGSETQTPKLSRLDNGSNEALSTRSSTRAASSLHPSVD